MSWAQVWTPLWSLKKSQLGWWIECARATSFKWQLSWVKANKKNSWPTTTGIYQNIWSLSSATSQVNFKTKCLIKTTIPMTTLSKRLFLRAVRLLLSAIMKTHTVRLKTAFIRWLLKICRNIRLARLTETRTTPRACRTQDSHFQLQPKTQLWYLLAQETL